LPYLALSTVNRFSAAIGEFKDQVDATERQNLEALIKELREIAVKAQAGDESITAEQIKEKIDKTQTASLSLFQKVYEKKAQENEPKKETPEATEVPPEKKD